MVRKQTDILRRSNMQMQTLGVLEHENMQSHDVCGCGYWVRTEYLMKLGRTHQLQIIPILRAISALVAAELAAADLVVVMLLMLSMLSVALLLLAVV